MKNLLLLLLFLNLQANIFGQNDISPNTQLLVKIAPLPLIDFFGNNACILSIEGKRQSLSVSADLGFLYHSIGYGLQNNRGFVGGIEVRKYLKKQAHKYFALGLRYKDQAYDYTDSIAIAGTPKYGKEYTYEKKVTAFNVMYGIQKVRVESRFLVNAYIGLGIKIKSTTGLGLTEEEAQNRDYGDSQVLPLLNKVGDHVFPNPLLGVKIGYALNKEW